MLSVFGAVQGPYKSGRDASFKGKIVYRYCRRPVFPPSNWDGTPAIRSAKKPKVRHMGRPSSEGAVKGSMMGSVRRLVEKSGKGLLMKPKVGHMGRSSFEAHVAPRLSRGGRLILLLDGHRAGVAAPWQSWVAKTRPQVVDRCVGQLVSWLCC